MAKRPSPNRESVKVPKASDVKKLYTPWVFTQPQEADPREWVSLDSSRVERARYDDGLSQVQVTFRKHGTPWVYEDVPSDVYDMFITSDSPGRFINDVLNRYPYRRATPLETMTW